MKIRATVITGVALTILLLVCPAWAAQKKEQKKRYVVSRIKGPVTLDGRSDEPAWDGIDPLPVVQHVPNFGSEPSERTDILLAYNDDYLYVAARLFDSEPGKIQVTSKKRDEIGDSSDSIGIIIDSFNDKENALSFLTTPSGLRTDIAVANDLRDESSLNVSWNTFWDTATARSKDGWFAEIRIPFSSLRFQDEDGRVIMGITVIRWISRKSEGVIFPPIPPEWGRYSYFKPSLMQEVEFHGVYSKNPLYITPYILGGIGQTYELDSNGTAYQRFDDITKAIGLDLKQGITSNLTLDITINTDFAQVEADDQQVNLTRFSLFFPEKRLFFLERASLFDFSVGGPNRVFYSRRVGLHEGKKVPIYGGVRLVGRVGKWDLGFMSMQTAPIDRLLSENFSVVRLRRQIFNPYSYLGGIITSRVDTKGHYNIAYAVDGIIRLFRDDYLTVDWVQTLETDLNNTPLSLDQARINADLERRSLKGFGYELSFTRTGIDYNPGMGFQVRGNYTRYGILLRQGWLPGKRSSLLHHQVLFNGFMFLNNTSGAVESAEIGPGWEFTTKTDHTGKIHVTVFHENVPFPFSLSEKAEVPRGIYTFVGANGEYSTPLSGITQVTTGVHLGSFYDGWRIALYIAPRWSVSSDLELSAAYEYNRASFSERGQLFNAHIGRLRALAMLSTKFSATAFIQYNSAVNAVIANIRIRYNPREGNDFYIVYNESLNTDRYRITPALPFTSDRTILLKYSYTFNF